MVGPSGQKEHAATLDTVQEKIRSMNPDVKKVVIQTGINDFTSSSNSVVQRKFTTVMKLAKTYHPRTQFYFTSLLDRDNSPDVAAINFHIKNQAMNHGYIYVDTASRMNGRSDFFIDRRHPNYPGTAAMVVKIKEALGIKRPDTIPPRPPPRLMKPQNTQIIGKDVAPPTQYGMHPPPQTLMNVQPPRNDAAPVPSQYGMQPPPQRMMNMQPPKSEAPPVPPQYMMCPPPFSFPPPPLPYCPGNVPPAYSPGLMWNMRSPWIQ